MNWIKLTSLSSSTVANLYLGLDEIDAEDAAFGLYWACVALMAVVLVVCEIRFHLKKESGVSTALVGVMFIVLFGLTFAIIGVINQ